MKVTASPGRGWAFGRRATRRFCAIFAAFCAVATFAALASAGPSSSLVPTTIALHAEPIFREAPIGFGWSEVIVSVENPTAAAVKGSLEVTSMVPYGREQVLITRAPFHAPAGRTVLLHLPTHAFAYSGTNPTVSAISDDGVKLASTVVTLASTPAPVLVDVDEPSRLAMVLRNVQVDLSYAAWGLGGSSSTTALQVGAATFDPTSGNPILPDQASAYAGATAVLIHSDALGRLDAAPLDALVDWVLSGGTLAVIPSRPDDLRSPTISGLVGGPAATNDPPGELLTASWMQERKPGSSPFASTPSGTGSKTARAGSGSTGTSAVDMSAATRARLTGYTGGNLRPSAFGASATYGRGEVHLMGFDPTVAPALDDPWVQGRMVALVARAWDRRASNVFREGGFVVNANQLNEVRRSLDPNENFRPALGVSAVLLVFYSILAGPVMFLRAKKINRPLRPLAWAPALSALTFAGVMLIGFVGRGWHGRSRRLSLVEAGGGMSRGAIRRYRGFFTSQSSAMSIASTDRTCMLDVLGDGDLNGQRTLRVDRAGVTLERVTSLPWQTVVVVEDGFLEIGAGVSLLRAPKGELDIVNHTGHPLRDLVLNIPGRPLAYFAVLGDGERVSSAAGAAMTSSSLRRTSGLAGRSVHPLDTSDFGPLLDPATSKRMRDGWGPLGSAAGDEVDWWPEDQPVLLAEIAGGEARKKDSGLPVEQDRTMLRIVGFGESP